MMRMLLGLSTPWPGADGAAGGHDGGRTGRLQAAGDHGIVAGIDEHLKAVGDELLGGLERFERVGQERLRVAQAFELDPIGAGIFQAQQDFAAHPGDAHRVGGVVAAGRVGQQRVAVEIEVVEDVFALAVVEALAADGDGDAIGAREGERFAHRVVGVVLAGADDEPARERVAAEAKEVGGGGEGG